jgi:hypothetical protein
MRHDQVLASRACQRTTLAYPAGRTGRDAGYQAHLAVAEAPCEPCRLAHLTKCQTRWADLTPEQQEARREANRAERARHLANSPEKARAAKHRRIAKQRQIIQSAKDRPCTDCGVHHPYYVMQFDHLTDKHFNIGQAVTQVSEARLRTEIAKCEVVCANCHAERTHRRRTEPMRSASESLPAPAVRVQADAAESGAA